MCNHIAHINKNHCINQTIIYQFIGRISKLYMKITAKNKGRDKNNIRNDRKKLKTLQD